MKKILSVVLASAMMLAAIASLAFVLAPGAGGNTTFDKPLLEVSDFYLTNEYSPIHSARTYGTPIARVTEPVYARNAFIRAAVEFKVYNPAVLANGVAPFPVKNNVTQDVTSTVVIKSDTVDLSYNNIVPMNLVFDDELVIVGTSKQPISRVAVTDVSASTVRAKKLIVDVVAKAGYLPENVDGKPTFVSASVADPVAPATEGVITENLLTLYSPKKATVAYNLCTLIFSGITLGEIGDVGAITLSVPVDNVDAIGSFDDDAVVVVRNGHTYRIYEEVLAPTFYDSTLKTKLGAAESYYNQGIKTYVVEKLVAGKADDDTTAKWAEIINLDTETITYKKNVGFDKDIEGTEVADIGRSLGTSFNATAIEDANTEANLGARTKVYRTTLYGNAFEYYAAGVNDKPFFPNAVATVNNAGIASGTTDYSVTRADFDTMLADFGFGTGDAYTFKVQDGNFLDAPVVGDSHTIEYNTGKVVVVEAEDGDDLAEGTDETEAGDDEGVIDEEPADEGTIDEDLPEDETGDEIDDGAEVPATGDSSSIALALAAAAVIAAAALVVVMKKARD